MLLINQCESRSRITVAVQQAHAADRCAREILAILTVSAARSRRLMGKPFGGSALYQL